MDTEKISRLVEEYFCSSLSVKEERELGRVLASIPSDKILPEWEDALAELALAARARTVSKTEDVSRPVGRIFNENASSPKKRIFIENAPLKYAASIAVIAAIGIAAFFGSRPSLQSDACYAYVDGVLVTDRQDISRLMDNQLRDMADAQENMMTSVNMDFSEMAAYMDDNE